MGMADLPGPATASELDELSASLQGHQYMLYDALHALYGDVMYQPADQFGVDIVTLFHPDDIESVIRNEGPLPRGLGQALLPFARYYKEHAPRGLNLGRIDGPEWKRVRKHMAKDMMPPRAAQSYLPHLARVMPACSAHLPQHAHALGEYVPLMTFEMICSVLLDRVPRIVSGEADPLDTEFVDTAKQVFPLMARLMAPSEMQAFLAGESPLYAQFEGVMHEVMRMGALYIKDFKARLARAGPDDTIHSCYFARLMAQPGGSPLDEHQMNVNFSNLIFAGVDTTSNVVQWMMYHLARNPRVQDKARAEASAQLRGHDVGVSDYKHMRYLRMVMKESYRLTPPVFGSARYLPQDLVLRGRHVIPAGTMIRLQPLPYLRSGEVWQQPLEFVPERWARDEGERLAMPGAPAAEPALPTASDADAGAACPMHAVAEHAYLWIVPFGVGKRMCMGARLAQVEVVSMFARVLQDYRIELEEGSPEPVPVFKMGMIEPSPSPRYRIVPLPGGHNVT